MCSHWLVLQVMLRCYSDGGISSFRYALLLQYELTKLDVKSRIVLEQGRIGQPWANYIDADALVCILQSS